ncbi:MAG: Thiol-disulfide isomerase or thioredoxin [Chloroflexi bacterium]|nr:MAG: Thiol-disulfide isomerase or thioredoxin [Chloroflexota bacterium]
MFLISLSAICFACSSQDLIVNENMPKGVNEKITDLAEEVKEEKGTPDSSETERRVDESVETPAAENKRPASAIYRPELTGISGYINVENFLLDDLKGKVILIDFWTYTCINCIRTFPYLKDWHAKYADDGLVIVGVHTPEFEFEKILSNVAIATREFGLEYPIVLDNERATWGAYQNQYWPAKYLIDRDGYVRYTHFGEGGYEETESVIRDLLQENDNVISESGNTFMEPRPYAEIPQDQTEVESQTRELYSGTIRNYNAIYIGRVSPYVAHEQFYTQRDVDVVYTDPSVHRNHFIYLNGVWLNKPESLKHSRKTEEYQDYVAILFYGTSANVVLKGFGESDSYTVMVYLDDMPLKREFAGEDIKWAPTGNSYIEVVDSRLYRLVKSPSYGGFELKISSNSEQFELFAFTFGSFQN